MADTFAEKKTDKSKLPSINAELGATGTQIYAGFIETEYNAKLAWPVGIKVYDQMRRSDSAIDAILNAVILPIVATKWYVEAAPDPETGDVSEESIAVANFVEKNIFEQMEKTWPELLREILTMLAFGHSVFEKVYDVGPDGTVILKNLATRIQESIYRWEMLNGEKGITQSLPLEKNKPPLVSIPWAQLVVFTYRREGDDYAGIPMLRSMYRDWYSKDKLLVFNMIRHERVSVGVPVITMPEGAQADDRAEAKKIGKNVRTTAQSVVVLPSDKWKFEFADVKGAVGTDITKDLQYHNREMAKAALAQFLELGSSGSGGSYSLSQDQSEIYKNALGAIAQYVADKMIREVIPELVAFNFNGVKTIPKLKYDKIGGIEFDKYSTMLKNLVDSGVVTVDDELERHVRATVDLPQPSERADTGSDKTEDTTETPATGSQNKPSEKPAQDAKPAEPVAAHEHWHASPEQRAYMEYSALVDNAMVIAIQNQAATPEDRERLKKKGLTLNEYESESPRPLTFAERKVNFKSIQRALDSFNEQLKAHIGEITGRQREDLLNQVRRAVENDNLEALSTMSLKYTGDLSSIITNTQKELFEIGKKGASTELGVQTPGTRNEVKGVMRVQNDAIVEKMASDAEAAAKLAATQAIQRNAGRISDTTSADAVAAAGVAVDKVFSAMLTTVPTLTMTGAVNMGRGSVYDLYRQKIYAFQYSAVLDNRTTDLCRSLDGRVVAQNSPEYVRFNPPQHYNCRSIWVAILNDEIVKPEITGIPGSITPTTSLDDFKDLKAPTILKNSPAIASIKKELEERKAKLEQLQKDGSFPNRQKQHETRIKQLERSLKGKFAELVRDTARAGGINFL